MAAMVAARTQDAFSWDRYAPKEWAKICGHLAAMGWNELQIEAVLRSKWTRWAADQSERPYGKITARDFVNWLASGAWTPDDLEERVEELVVGTFPAIDTLAQDIVRGQPAEYTERDARRYLRTLPIESEQRRVWVRAKQLAERIGR